MPEQSPNLLLACLPAMAGLGVGWWLLHALRRWIEDQYTLDGTESVLIASRVAVAMKARQALDGASEDR